MKRSITSLKNANRALLSEISKIYPKGVDESDLVSFPTTNGTNLRAIEIELDDTLYLVKLDDEKFYRAYVAKDEDNEEEDSDETGDSDEGLEDLEEE